MLGRAVRLFAATAALTFAGLSGASAGWLSGGYGYGGYGYGGYGYGGYGYGGNGYGFGGGCCGAPAPVNWGCGNSCAPLYPSFTSVNCCAPVRWGCGNPCGSYGYGYGYQTAYQQPIYVVPQGPTYQLPATGYTYPTATYDEPNDYPYVSRYSYPRPYYRPRVAHYHHRRYEGGHSYRHRPYYGPRRGHHRYIDLPPK
jgi:hypothetical protein